MNPNATECPISKEPLGTGYGDIPIFFEGERALIVSGMITDDKTGHLKEEYADKFAQYVTSNNLSINPITGADVLKNSRDNPGVGMVGTMRPEGPSGLGTLF